VTSLARRWPRLAELPYVSIAELPTPLDDVGVDDGPLAASRPAADPDFQLPALLVKRDDLTSAVYGGNKVRKLEFLLGDAIARGAKSVMTFGAYGSNHALATAVHGSALGLDVHVVLSPQAPTSNGRDSVLSHAGIGTSLHVIDDYAQAGRFAVGLRARLRERDGVEPYVIPAGGSSPVGAVGYVNAAVELAEQVDSAVKSAHERGQTEPASRDVTGPDVIYVAAGTLGTAVGLAIGLAATGSPTRVEAVRVTPEEMANADVARELAEHTIALLKTADPTFPRLTFEDLAIRLRDDQYGDGYAMPTQGAQEALRLAEHAGLHLETTYTAKALSAFVADSRAGLLRDEHVLFWDTYSSAPKPPAGEVATLPPVLQEWVAAADELG